MTRSRLARLAILGALLALPAVAGAAPISVTYEITGGTGSGHGYPQGQYIQSGTIRVSFPNPGSGAPPLASVGHSIYVHFFTASSGGGFPGTFKRTFKPADFPQGMAFRGASQTLRANRSRPVCVGGFYTYYGVPVCRLPTGREWFSIHAAADGRITQATWYLQATAEDTGAGWRSITGQEVASTPEPASGSLLALAGAGAVGAAAVARRRWRS